MGILGAHSNVKKRYNERMEEENVDKKLLIKMIQQCFKQYGYDEESIPLTNKEYDGLCTRILHKLEIEPEIELYEWINDLVYEFITDEKPLI